MMRADRFRFRPPELVIPAELEWTLSRALGATPGRPIRLEHPERVLDWAAALGLRERIASRVSDQDARRELPAGVVDSLQRSKEALAARTLLLQTLLERVANAAVTIGAPVIALKGIALLESGRAPWGGRPLLDLDLLVDTERARELAGALEELGMTPSAPGEEHHLAPLADPRLGEVELHHHIPGLEVGRRRPATAADLRAAGLVRASERLEGLELPAPELLAAHAIAHGLDQHGLSPTAYPITRLIADLVDLDGAGSLGPEARGWLRASTSARELEALLELRSTLGGDSLPSAERDAGALLRHTLAAISSLGYRKKLRRRAALRALRRGRWSKFRSELCRRAGGPKGLG